MSKKTHATEPSRRRFLRTLAVAGGSAAIPLGFSSAASALTPGTHAKLRVGLALPHLDQANSSSTALLDSFRLALADTPNLQLEIAGDGSLQSQARKLSQSGIDLIIGSATPHIARQLGRTLKDSRALFLNVEPGAQMQRAKDMQANVFHHTLQLWQAHYATGAAAITRGSRAAIFSTFHESGYDGNTAFNAGFESAGGTVVSQVVYRADDTSSSLAQAIATLQRAQPDFIYVNANGERADELIKMIGSSDTLRAPFAQAGDRIDSTFAQAYQQATGRSAEAYALLGYEAGQLLRDAAARMSEQGLTLHAALAQASFTSPRGSVKMQSPIQTTLATTYVNARGDVLRDLAAIPESQARNHSSWAHAISGWSLPYGANAQPLRA